MVLVMVSWLMWNDRMPQNMYDTIIAAVQCRNWKYSVFTGSSGSQ